MHCLAKVPTVPTEDSAMLILAIAVLFTFGAILAWDLAGQPTRLRHFRKLLGLKSRRKR
jgi:hypothetical protein